MIEHLREAVSFVLTAVETPILVYFLAINTSYLVLMVAAAADFRAHLRRQEYLDRDAAAASPLVPGVSLVVPAHNEEPAIVSAVESLLSLRHPRHEVVVVDDGSTDGTFAALVDRFDLVGVDREIPMDVPVRAAILGMYVPQDGRTRLVVVRKENSGKTEAVNTGINAGTQPLVAIVDADSVLDPDALIAVTQPFVVDPVRTVATGGVVRAANGCTVTAGRITKVGMPREWLARIQVVEYLRAFLLGRSGWSRLRGLILISGAFGVFRRDLLVEIGGLDHGSIGEDFELVMRLHDVMTRRRADYRVAFVSEPVAWTEVPVTPRILARQRRRWHRGLWEVLWKYRGMLFRRRMGRIGFVVLPWFWLFELAAPVLELAGLVLVGLGLVLGLLDWGWVLLFMAVAYGYASVVNLVAIAIEELSFHRYPRWRDLALSLVASVFENFGYRQMTAFWRCQGLLDGVRGRTQVWGPMTRRGFTQASTGSLSQPALATATVNAAAPSLSATANALPQGDATAGRTDSVGVGSREGDMGGLP